MKPQDWIHDPDVLHGEFTSVTAAIQFVEDEGFKYLYIRRIAQDTYRIWYKKKEDK